MTSAKTSAETRSLPCTSKSGRARVVSSDGRRAPFMAEADPMTQARVASATGHRSLHSDDKGTWSLIVAPPPATRAHCCTRVHVVETEGGAHLCIRLCVRVAVLNVWASPDRRAGAAFSVTSWSVARPGQPRAHGSRPSPCSCYALAILCRCKHMPFISGRRARTHVDARAGRLGAVARGGRRGDPWSVARVPRGRPPPTAARAAPWSSTESRDGHSMP